MQTQTPHNKAPRRARFAAAALAAAMVSTALFAPGASASANERKDTRTDQIKTEQVEIARGDDLVAKPGTERPGDGIPQGPGDMKDASCLAPNILVPHEVPVNPEELFPTEFMTIYVCVDPTIGPEG